MLQTGMYVVWIRCYHLICRDCYNTFKSYKSNYYRFFGIVWAAAGTLLVEVWVSSAWTMHLTYASFMKLEKEKLFNNHDGNNVETKISSINTYHPQKKNPSIKTPS
jgi:hypothetical protein